MNDYWLKIGCFLTGYNYKIIKDSSEASTKAVKKYLSALIIVCILWAYIGFAFSQRYIHTSMFGSVCIAFIMLVIIIQIERQIILTTGRATWALLFRSIIAVIMAVIGSIIIDQIIFKDDVEIQQITNIQEKVDKILTIKTKLLDNDIATLDSLIARKEKERNKIINEVTRKPFVKGSTVEKRNHVIKVSNRNASKDSIITRTDVTLTDIVNPKAELIPSIDLQIANLRTQVADKQKARINIRQNLENEFRSKTGFLDELKTLISILVSHYIALIVWILIFLFFLSLEIFILVIKIGDVKNDYDKIILHQMNMRVKMIEELANQYSKNIVE